MNETDKAYVAGIIDGEGHVAIKRWKSKRNDGTYCYNVHSPCINIAMTDLHFVSFLQDVIKPIHSSIYARQFPNPRWKESYTLYVRGKAAIDLALEVLPYLRLKRSHAEILVQYPIGGPRHTTTPVRCELYAKMREFNALIRTPATTERGDRGRIRSRMQQSGLLGMGNRERLAEMTNPQLFSGLSGSELSH